MPVRVFKKELWGMGKNSNATLGISINPKVRANLQCMDEAAHAGWHRSCGLEKGYNSC